MKQYILVIFLFTYQSVFSQKISEEDSLLRRKYYQRVFPKAVNSRTDLLYYGIDNELTLQYPDQDSKKLKYLLKTHNGKIFESDSGSYLTIPRNAGRAFISVYMLTAKDTLSLGKKEFTVVPLPLPALKIGNVVIKDQTIIEKSTFYKKDSLKVFFTDDIENSDCWCKVEHFNVGYAYGSRYISVDNNGALLSKETLDLISKLKNQEVVIKVTNINCSQIYKSLPLVRFRVQ
jgi:hypothetical protein